MIINFDDDYVDPRVQLMNSKQTNYYVTNDNIIDESNSSISTDDEIECDTYESSEEDFSDIDIDDYDYDVNNDYTNVQPINDFIKNKAITNSFIRYELKYKKYSFDQIPNFNYEKNMIQIKNDFKCFDTSIFNCIVVHDSALFNYYYSNLLSQLNRSYHFEVDFISTERRNIFTTFILHITNVPENIKLLGHQVFMLDNNIIFELLVGRGAIYHETTKITGDKCNFTLDYRELNKEITTNKPSNYYEGNQPQANYSPFNFKVFKCYPNDYMLPTHLGISCKYAFKSEEEKRKINHKCEKKYSGSYCYPDRRMLYKFVAYSEPIDQDMFCISERVGKYFMFFVDLDLDDKHWNVMKQHNPKITFVDFWDKFINAIIQTLKSNIVPINGMAHDNFYSYIYSHKSHQKNKVHLYFPNIIVDKYHARSIRDLSIKSINLVSGDFLKSIIEKVYDISPYSGSLRLLYQRKCCDKEPYDLVPERSTYSVPYSKEYSTLIKAKNLSNKKKERLSEIRFNYLILVSVNLSHTEMNCVAIENSDIKKLCNTVMSHNEIKHKSIVTRVERRINTINISVDHSKINVASCLKEMEEKLKQIDELKLYTDYKSSLEMIAHRRATIIINTQFIYDLANNLSKDRIETYKTWLDFLYFCNSYGLYELAHLISQKVFNSTEESKELITEDGEKIIKVNDKYNPIMIDNILKSHHECNSDEKFCRCKVISFHTFIRWSAEDNITEHNIILKKEYAGSFEEKDFTGNNSLMFLNGLTQFNLGLNLVNYDEEFMLPYPTDTRLTFVKGKLGGGKTKQMCHNAYNVLSEKNCGNELSEYINPLFVETKIKRIVIISSRCALTLGLQKSMVEYGIDCKHYKGIDIDFEKDMIISITPDSLTKYKEINNFEDFNVDMVIIDEIESFLNYVAMSSTLEDKRHVRKEVFEILCKFLRNSKKILLMDGHLNYLSINFIMSILAKKDPNENKLLKDSTKIIYNSNYIPKKQYIQIRNKRRLNDILIKHLEDKKKIFICTDSLGESVICNDVIKEYFKNKEYKPVGIIYNSETCDEDKNKLADCNTIWIQYDYVIVSPTVIYGLDFSVKNYFHNIFSINVNDRVFTPNAIHQQINRVRYPISPYVYVFCGKSTITMSKHKSFKDGYAKLNQSYLKTRLFNSEIPTINKKEEQNDNISDIKINYNELAFNDKLKAINNLFGYNMETKLKDNKLLKNYVSEFDFSLYDTSNFKYNEYLYDVNELGDMLYNYQNALTEFMHEYFYTCLGNYFCEYDGITFIQTNFTFDRENFKKSLAKVMRDKKVEFDKEQIESIIQGSKRSVLYDDIIYKSNKTTEDHFTIIGTNILYTYGLRTLNESFFEKYPLAKQVSKFITSTKFSMKEKSIKNYYEFKNNTNFESINNKEMQRMILVKKLLECFFPDGLADDSLSIVTSLINRLTEKQKEFINEYFYENGVFVNKVNALFYGAAKSVKSVELYNNNKNKKKDKIICVTEITPLHMMHWLNIITQQYFGYEIKKNKIIKKSIVKEYFIKEINNIPWNIVSCENEIVNLNDKGSKKYKFDIDKLRIYAYCYKQQQMKYIELLLNSRFRSLDQTFLDKVSLVHYNIKCEFSDLHSADTIGDIYNRHNDFERVEFEEYEFEDYED